MSTQPRTCDFCGRVDHLIATCPKLQTFIRDPVKAARIRNILQAALASRGGTQTSNSTNSAVSSSSSSPRARTPPLSNRTVAQVDLHGDDTDDDVTISQLETDDEATDTEPDF